MFARVQAPRSGRAAGEAENRVENRVENRAEGRGAATPETEAGPPGHRPAR